MKKALLLLFFIVIHCRLLAWGKQGHALIAEIAKSRLEKGVIDVINHYLDGKPWGELACWMDDVRDDQKFAYMKPWHHVHLDKDKTYVKTREPDLINQLEFTLKTLKNRSIYYKEDIAQALKVVFHLVGDIHQPLHCGYTSDNGGNSIMVTFSKQASTLHKVWDSDIIEEKKITIWDCLKLIISVSEEKKIKSESDAILSWMNESRLLLPQVYKLTNPVIGKDYTDPSAEIIKLQLARAGVRLANLLNMLFKD